MRCILDRVVLDLHAREQGALFNKAGGKRMMMHNPCNRKADAHMNTMGYMCGKEFLYTSAEMLARFFSPFLAGIEEPLTVHATAS